MIGDPPDEGAVKVTVAWVLPATATTFVGALGAAAGVALVPCEAEEVPAEFVAVTVNVCGVRLGSGEITQLVAGETTEHVGPLG